MADLSTEMNFLSDNAEAAGLATFQMVGHTGRRRSIVSTAIAEGFTFAEDEFPTRFSSADSVVTLNAGRLTLGPELVVNGAFDDPGTPGFVPGWSSALGIVPLTVVNGQLHVEATADFANQQVFTTDVMAATLGQNYRFSAEGFGQAGVNYSIQVLAADSSTVVFDSGTMQGADTTTAVITAIDTGFFVILNLLDLAALGEFAEFDNVSLRLIT